MTAVESIKAFGLDRLSKAELMEFLRTTDPPIPADAVTFQSARPTEEYGEPGTIIVILSIIALKAFVSWLALRSRNKHITQTITVQLSDSTTISKTIDVTVPESGDAKPELIKELLNIDGLTTDAKTAIQNAIAG